MRATETYEGTNNTGRPPTRITHGPGDGAAATRTANRRADNSPATKQQNRAHNEPKTPILQESCWEVDSMPKTNLHNLKPL
jgi:hypothetical protein